RSRPRFAWWPQMIIGVASAAALAIAVLFWKLPSRNESHDRTDLGVAMEDRSVVGSDTTIPAAKFKAESDEFKKNESAVVALKDQPAPTSPSKELNGTGDVAKQVEPRRQEADALDLAGVPVATNAIVARAAPSVPAAVPAPTTAPIEAPIAATVPATVAPATPAESAAAVPAGSVAASTDAPLASRNIAKSESMYFDRKTDAIEQKQQQQRQRLKFSQIDNRSQYRLNLNSPPLPKVLTSFGLERTGSNVLVVDADGSTYSGNVLPAMGGYGGQLGIAGGSAKSASTVINGEAIPDDNFAFKVSGYNKKLRAKVIFSGSVINSMQNGIVAGSAITQTQSGVQNQTSNKPQQSPARNAQNIQLNGRVQVGRSTEFQIQAAPVGPVTK
ncbi:MAG: hypothetical protein ACXWDN_06240, partial [Limisphaerales bacterium]